MKIIKQDPELRLLDNFFDSFFRDEPLHWTTRKVHNKGQVSVNIFEDSEAYHLEVLAPGFGKEDLKIELENNLLKLSASKEEKMENETRNYRRLEFRTAGFERSFKLPEGKFDEENISASFDNGILNLRIAKLAKEDSKLSKLIEIS